MNKLLILILLLSSTSYAFRLSRLTQNGVDVAKDAYYRWKSNTVTLGLGIDPEAGISQASTVCATVPDQEAVVKSVIDTINSIAESALELKWGGTSGASDINIFSYTQAEWDANIASGSTTWDSVGTNVLGFTSTSATCSKTKVCYFNSAPIRMRCDALAQMEDDESLVDFESVLLHELIHALGLDHTSVQENVMYYALSSGTALKRTLTKDDEGGLTYLYPKTQGPSFLKYLVCGNVGNIGQSGSRVANILLLCFSPLFIILCLKRRKFRSDVL